MKKLHTFILAAVLGLLPACAQAQLPAKAAKAALTQSAAKGAAETAVKQAADGAVRAGVSGAAVSAVQIPAAPAQQNINLQAIEQQVQQAQIMPPVLPQAAPPANIPLSERLTPQQRQETHQQALQFITENKRFPEDHFGEYVEGLPNEILVSFAQESYLRNNIDRLINLYPESPFAQDLAARLEKFEQAQLDRLNQALRETMPQKELEDLAEKTTTTGAFSEPVALNLEGLPNAYQLTENFYRGGQPTEEGYRALAQRGVKTIISFRVQKPDTALIESLGMKSVHIPTNPALITPAQMSRFLRIVADPDHQPVYVHCLYGSDRTGTMVAMYRMTLHKWSRQEALAEMKNPQYGHNKLFFTLPGHIKVANVQKLTDVIAK